MTQPETTGPHQIPPPPRESDPPISAKGASWKTIAAALGVIAGIAGSTITLSYQIGQKDAEQRARDAEQGGQLEMIVRRLDRLGAADEHHREELTAHRERILRIRHDVDENAREIRELNKRRERRAVHD